jgi:hypothetical protein
LPGLAEDLSRTGEGEGPLALPLIRTPGQVNFFLAIWLKSRSELNRRRHGLDLVHYRPCRTASFALLKLNRLQLANDVNNRVLQLIALA